MVAISIKISYLRSGYFIERRRTCSTRCMLKIVWELVESACREPTKQQAQDYILTQYIYKLLGDITWPMVESVTLYRGGGFFWCDALPSSLSARPPPRCGTTAHSSRTDYKSLEYLPRYSRCPIIANARGDTNTLVVLWGYFILTLPYTWKKTKLIFRPYTRF